ncbi:uncharacterized protein LOC112568447 [Pomacea canaliculata]|uniref:uncharacterized protein LOC112568447 n=1 Tax=Pomacea canaliculata TaxID=400727 RepID=UPI000D7262EF|nr:uncharacterized protein LOC112568447 [Pomacea canaliculata]
MARDPKEASKQRKFRCRPFVTEDAFRAESCAVLTSLTSPITKNVRPAVTWLSSASTLVQVLRFNAEEISATRRRATCSHPAAKKDNNSQVEVRIELPRQQRAGWVEYRCVPHDVSQVQTTGCRANFSQPPVTSEVSTTDKVPRKETNITGNKETHFDALVHIIVTGCFIGITTIAVVVVLAVGIRLLRRRVYDKQQWANNVFSGLSAPRPSGPTHQESGNIYDEIPSHQWHKKLVSTDTVDQKTADAVISRCSLPPVDRDNRNNKHEIITQTPADLSDAAPEDNPHIILHRQNALKPRDSTSHTLPPFDLQTNLNSLASDSSSVSSSLSSPSQRSSLPLSSEASSSYLHPVSEVSIMVDVDLDVRARQRALYQVLDCGYVDFKVYEALPKPCSPRLQRAARKMETNHNRWSQ